MLTHVLLFPPASVSGEMLLPVGYSLFEACCVGGTVLSEVLVTGTRFLRAGVSKSSEVTGPPPWGVLREFSGNVVLAASAVACSSHVITSSHAFSHLCDVILQGLLSALK